MPSSGYVRVPTPGGRSQQAHGPLPGRRPGSNPAGPSLAERPGTCPSTFSPAPSAWPASLGSRTPHYRTGPGTAPGISNWGPNNCFFCKEKPGERNSTPQGRPALCHLIVSFPEVPLVVSYGVPQRAHTVVRRPEDRSLPGGTLAWASAGHCSWVSLATARWDSARSPPPAEPLLQGWSDVPQGAKASASRGSWNPSDPLLRGHKALWLTARNCSAQSSCPLPEMLWSSLLHPILLRGRVLSRAEDSWTWGELLSANSAEAPREPHAGQGHLAGPSLLSQLGQWAGSRRREIWSRRNAGIG